MQQAKMLLGCLHTMWECLDCRILLLFPIQPAVNTPGRQNVMTQMPRLLPARGRTQMGFQTPGLVFVLSLILQAYENEPADINLSVTQPLNYTTKKF